MTVEFGHKISFALLNRSRTQVLARIPFVVRAEYVKVLSDVGVLKLRVIGTGIALQGGGSLSGSQLNGYYIRVDIGVDGVGIGTKAQDGVYIIKDMRRTTENSGANSFEVTAYDYNMLLDNAIIAYRGETAKTTKSGDADDVMKALVRENIGSSSGTDYDGNAITARAFSGLVVDSDLGAGPSVTTTGIEWQRLLDTLKDIQAATTIAGSETFFGIIPNGTNGAPRFRTAVGLWGANKSSRVYFKASNSTLINPTVDRRYRYAASTAYVGESGDPESRIIQTVESDGSPTSLKFANTETSRREVWVNGGRIDPESADITTELRLVARNELARKRAFLVLSGAIISNRNAPYKFSYNTATGWDLGDRVTCSIDTSASATTFTADIRAVQVTLDESGKVSVAARVESLELL